MSAGSEKISARWIEGAERRCSRCGAEIRNLERDVGAVHTRYLYPGVERWIVCSGCHVGRRAAT